MPILEPPGFPTGNLATQDAYSISRYLNDPTMVMRALRTLADQIFVGNKILTGQFFTTDGSIIYEQIESIFAANTPVPVAPGGEFPLTPVPTGPAQIADVVKWGLDTIITDESIARQNFDVVSRAFIKIVNSMVQQIDSEIMNAVASAITFTSAAGATTLSTPATPNSAGSGATAAEWTASTSNILRDIFIAEESVRALKQGYNLDTVILDLETYANVVGSTQLAPLWPREDFGRGVNDMPVMAGVRTGLQTKLAGKTWLATPNTTVTPYVAMIDSTVFGAMVDERLPAPGYVGASGDGGDDDGRSMIQVKTMREDKDDKWRIRCRRTTTPIIIEPFAGIEITGVGGSPATNPDFDNG
jgi:hypothetical protein